MKIEVLVLGQLRTNCYLIWDENGESVIIDPADEGDFIAQKILELRLRPRLIIATHGHFDHLLAATEIKLAFSIPFFMHKGDFMLLKRTQSTAQHFSGLKADPPPTIDEFLQDGDEISFGREKLNIIATPGHTPGSICLYASGFLFSGDTLFHHGFGRTDFSYGSNEKIMLSIKEKLLILPDETRVFPGHGPQTTIASAKKLFKIKAD